MREGEHSRNGARWWEGKIAVCRCAACNLPVNHALLDRIAPDEFTADGQPRIGVRRGLDAEFAERTRQTAHMAVEIDKLSVQHRDDLIHRVRKQEATVKDRNPTFGFWDVVPVEIDGAHLNAVRKKTIIVNRPVRVEHRRDTVTARTAYGCLDYARHERIGVVVST